MDSGAVAPPVHGTVFQLMTDVTLHDSGKVTLLYFWYHDCPECIATFPAMTKIYNKYKGAAFQLIGVNSIDSTERNMKRLPNFFNYNKMKYYTLLVRNAIPNAYRVHEYPSFYIVDKNGNVAFTHAGYNDELVETLDKKISQLLK